MQKSEKEKLVARLRRAADAQRRAYSGNLYHEGIAQGLDDAAGILGKVRCEDGAHWTPCSERLPEIGDTYIVTGIQKDSHEKEWHYFVDVASNYGDYIDDYWDTFNDWIEGQETHVIAWMPLPEPYEERRESDEAD